jgi:hypothetical protein
MEQEQVLQQDIFDAEISEESARHLTAISQWMQINAIVALASLGISVISTVIMMSKISSLGLGSGVASGGMAQVILTMTVSILLNLLLLQASANIKKGIQLADQSFLNKGLGKMAAYFKTLAILLIVVIGLVFLFFLIFSVA